MTNSANTGTAGGPGDSGAPDPRLQLVLLWNMHQPEYRDLSTREPQLPWVYLHAMKDYSDMAWHLEHHPGMRAVVNFTPVLLDQLDDYTGQFATGDFRDPLLRLLARRNERPLTDQERAVILELALEPEHARIIRPFSAYKGLREVFDALSVTDRAAQAYLSDQYFMDLLVWYHLCWTGETVRRGSADIARLMSVGARFNGADRACLVALIGRLVAGIVPRYSALAHARRIELCTTPHFHPLSPLLISFASAREAGDDLVLPRAPHYPGGTGRVDWQLDSALQAHASHFGGPCTGVWPAEGGISEAFLDRLLASGCAWTASGSGVMRNSLPQAARQDLYRPYRYGSGERQLQVFFRDDHLSDLIGFEYSKWNGGDAAANLISRLEDIAAVTTGRQGRVVSIILDGENCWEFYPYNGYYFIDRLYSLLESHGEIRPTTFGDCLAQASVKGGSAAMERVTAGSWVYGTFSTWIGSADKNRAWDLLCAAKQSYDLVLASGRLTAEQTLEATRRLAVCEGSDWFWWMGDYNPERKVRSMERLFRLHLGNLYAVLQLPVPLFISQPLCRGAGDPEASGLMRRSAANG